MMDAKPADLISALPDKAALAGIRAYILHEGLEGNLEDAAKAFEQVWQCAGHEGIQPGNIRGNSGNPASAGGCSASVSCG